MKKVVTVFPRDRYCSDSTGNAQPIQMKDKLLEIIGSADDTRWELTTYATSGAIARILVTVTEGTKADVRPSTNIFAGVPLTFFPSGSPTPAPTIGVVETQVNGPFAGILDVVIKVFDVTVPPATAVWVDAELRVTQFFK